MTFSEVYIGLQQGTIDAQENALPLIVTAKLYEQQKRVVKTNAVPDLVTLIASGVFMDSLTDEQAAIIEEAARLAQEDANKISDQKAEEAIHYLEEAGMEIVTPSEQDYADMREMCKPVWDTIREDCGAELFDSYTAIVNKEQ
jgi:TRAP-type C4-dicarboxylate transport system substrate-binding protein